VARDVWFMMTTGVLVVAVVIVVTLFVLFGLPLSS
jgi:hypothetical protein